MEKQKEVKKKLQFVCNVQDISYWNVKSDFGLTERNMQVRLDLKVVLEFWDRDIFNYLYFTASFYEMLTERPLFDQM